MFNDKSYVDTNYFLIIHFYNLMLEIWTQQTFINIMIKLHH